MEPTYLPRLSVLSSYWQQVSIWSSKAMQFVIVFCRYQRASINTLVCGRSEIQTRSVFISIRVVWYWQHEPTVHMYSGEGWIYYSAIKRWSDYIYQASNLNYPKLYFSRACILWLCRPVPGCSVLSSGLQHFLTNFLDRLLSVTAGMLNSKIQDTRYLVIYNTRLPNVSCWILSLPNLVI